ncbi:MAG: hypothetical protein JNM46_05360, partial [Anaerolineales bacterium]|nr:hypothetical protein [Anaerolineales bacterium]
MSIESSSSNKTKVCPTCGTRLSENAVRCLVCGTEFNIPAGQPKSAQKAAQRAEKSVQASRLPQVTLSLPAAIGVLAVVIILAASIVYFTVRASAPEGTFDVVDTPTPTETPTITPSPTATLPATDIPTATPQP